VNVVPWKLLNKSETPVQQQLMMVEATSQLYSQ